MKTIRMIVNFSLGLLLFLASTGLGWCAWPDYSSDVTTSLAPYDTWPGSYTYNYGADGATLTPTAGHNWPAAANPFAHQANAITLGSADYPLPATGECKILMPNVSATFSWGWLNGGVAGYNVAIRYRTYNASAQIVDDGIYCAVNGKTFAQLGCPASITTANPVTLYYVITTGMKFVVGARTSTEIWWSAELTPSPALSVGGPMTVYGGMGILGAPAGPTAVDATDPAQAILKIQAVQTYEGVPPGFPAPTPAPTPEPTPVGWAQWSAGDLNASLAPFSIFTNAYTYDFGNDAATLTPKPAHTWPAAANPFAHQANAITPGIGDYTLPGTMECKILMPSVSACFDWGWLNSGVVYYSCAIRYRTYNGSGQIVDDGIYSWINGQTFAQMGCPASIATANPVTLFYTITTDLKFIVGAWTPAGLVWSSPPLTPSPELVVGGPSTVYVGKGFRGAPADASAVDATDGAQAVLKIQAVQAYAGDVQVQQPPVNEAHRWSLLD